MVSDILRDFNKAKIVLTNRLIQHCVQLQRGGKIHHQIPNILGQLINPTARNKQML